MQTNCVLIENRVVFSQKCEVFKHCEFKVLFINDWQLTNDKVINTPNPQTSGGVPAGTIAEHQTKVWCRAIECLLPSIGPFTTLKTLETIKTSILSPCHYEGIWLAFEFKFRSVILAVFF